MKRNRLRAALTALLLSTCLTLNGCLSAGGSAGIEAGPLKAGGSANVGPGPLLGNLSLDLSKKK